MLATSPQPLLPQTVDDYVQQDVVEKDRNRESQPRHHASHSAGYATVPPPACVLACRVEWRQQEQQARLRLRTV